MTRFNFVNSAIIGLSATLASAAIWHPAPGLSWNYQLLNPPSSTATQGFQVWDIDLFDTPVATIDGLKANGAKVICYFSAGTFENWRPDASQFPDADKGANVDGWAGERWVRTSSTAIRNIMTARMDMAVQKHCDAVDPDNMDAYNNGGGGFGLTQSDAINYITFLSSAAHARNLAIGLKNSAEIISTSVINLVEFSVNEECAPNNECNTFHAFIDNGKPVFHVEYPKGSAVNTNNVSATQKNKACNAPGAGSFSNIIKNINLDSWYQKCT